jgi:hypothetical protein
VTVIIVEAVEKWAVLFCPLFHNLPEIKGAKPLAYL